MGAKAFNKIAAGLKEAIAMARARERRLLDGKVVLRPDDKGQFDELFLMDGKHCLVHAEMMSDGELWIGIYPRGEKERRVCMWIHAKGSKLKINADED